MQSPKRRNIRSSVHQENKAVFGLPYFLALKLAFYWVSHPFYVNKIVYIRR